MIKGIHGMFYTPKADELRAFLRDKMGIPFKDVGEGWLIFNMPESEVGVHPAGESPHDGPGAHGISFYTDDIQAEVARLRAAGVKFDGEVVDHGWGLAIPLTMPGGVQALVYQRRYV